MGPFWRRFWTLLGAQIASSSAQEAPRSLQDAPRRPQDEPKLPSSLKILFFQKVVKNPRKNNDSGSPGQLQIDPRWPQARSRWPKIDPRRLQDGLEKCFCRCSKSSSIWRRLGVVLASILAPFGLPKCVSFGTLLASQIDQKSIRNQTTLKVVPRSPQERPRPSQDAPGSPPDTPRTLQDAFQTPPGRPQTPSQTPRMNQKAFPKHVAQ